LVSFEGLNNLIVVSGQFNIEDNFALQNFNGLESLMQVGSFQIINNYNLNSLDGVNNLHAVTWQLRITDNSNLEDISALQQLQACRTINIIRNFDLTTLNSFNNLSDINIINIEGNIDLINLNAFENLVTVSQYLRIANNSNLTSLEAFSQLTFIGGNLEVLDNPQLSQCCGLCPLFTTDAVIGGVINIANNLTGCNNIAEISACSPCGLVNTSNPEYDPTQLTIYPNPAKNILHFQYDSPVNELVNFTIENHLGQQVIQSQVYANQPVQIDISDYTAGLYLLNVIRKDESESRLFSVAK